MDKQEIAAIKAVNPIVDVVGRYVTLTAKGTKYKGLCPFHEDHDPSFWVYPDKGYYTCYACQVYGDVLDFVQHVESCDFHTAVEKLTGKTLAKPNGIRAPTPLKPANTIDHWKPIIPVPTDAEPMDPLHIFNPNTDSWRDYEPNEVYPYESPQGIHGYVFRIDLESGGKIIMPVTYCTDPFGERRWVAKGMPPKDRPLFGLMDLKARPDAQVMVVEGERTKQAASQLLSKHVVITWCGGANAVSQTDFSPLYSRDVILWPDADNAGNRAMEAIAQVLHIAGNAVRIIDTQNLPKAWDAFDALQDPAFKVGPFVKDRLRPYNPDVISVPSEDRDEAPAEVPIERAFRFRHVTDLIANPRPPQWLVKGFIELNSLSMLFSDPGVGKSFLAVDLAAAVATGTAWHGQKVHRGPVVYVAGEGEQGIGRRFKAWGISRSQNFADHKLYVSHGGIRLTDNMSKDDVLLAFNRLTAGIEEQPSLIIIDTVARSFGPADENSTQDMGVYIQAVDEIRNLTGAAVLLVHHTGRDKTSKDRARGSMALTAALDFEYRLSRSEDEDDKTLTLDNTKCKDHEPPEPKYFRISGVDLGLTDEDGDPVTAGVISAVTIDPVGATTVKSGAAKDRILSTIREMAFAHNGGDPSILYKECRLMLQAEGMKRQTFDAAVRSLKASRQVRQVGDYLSLTLASK